MVNSASEIFKWLNQNYPSWDNLESILEYEKKQNQLMWALFNHTKNKGTKAVFDFINSQDIKPVIKEVFVNWLEAKTGHLTSSAR